MIYSSLLENLDNKIKILNVNILKSLQILKFEQQNLKYLHMYTPIKLNE